MKTCKLYFSLFCLFAVLAFVTTGCGNDDDEQEQQFTVIFDSQGGSQVASQMVAPGSKVREPLAPTKENAAFGGWYKESACVNAWNFNQDVVNGDMTLYAKWTEISMNALRDLVAYAESLNEDNYEEASYRAMYDKLNAARNVIYGGAATSEEIRIAYEELSRAIANMIELPYRATAKIEIEPSPINGVIFVVPGNWINLSAEGENELGEESTQSAVIFEYDLGSWISPDYEVYKDDHNLSFYLDENVAYGSTRQVTVKSVENASISLTVTLKAVSVEELVNQFVQLVNSFPQTVTMENYEDAARLYMTAENLASQCANSGGFTQEFESARSKMYQFGYLLDDIVKFAYTFEGNKCKMTEVVYNETFYCDYQPSGNFPYGAYTSDWEDWGDGYYAQTRITLYPDGNFYSEYRMSYNADGSNASQWDEDGSGKYIYTGNREQGGTVTMQYNDDEDVRIIKRVKK